MKRLTLIATSVLLAIGSPAFADITGLTIDNLGTFSESTGEARVSGTVTCTTAVSLRALAGQAHADGSTTVVASSSPGMPCTGSSQPWTVVFPSSPTLFGTPPPEAGPARCNVTASDSPTPSTSMSREEWVDLQPAP